MRQHRSRLLPLLLLGLIAVAVLEVWLLLTVAHWIGVLPTVGILVAQALLGGWLIRREGGRAYRALNEAFLTGRVPTRELSDTALVLVGGGLLVIPGFATDLLGLLCLLCLLPLARPLTRRFLGWLVTRRLARAGATLLPTYGSGTVIEGEAFDSASGPGGPGAGAGAGAGAEIIRGEIEEPGRDDPRR